MGGRWAASRWSNASTDRPLTIADEFDYNFAPDGGYRCWL